MISKYNLYFLLNFFIIKTILCQSDECEFDTPIKMGNNCLSTYCNKSKFESGDCIISNSKVKTQWLNNIILVGERNFLYVTLKKSSKSELILATSPFTSSSSIKDRIYFGINSNGSAMFKDSHGNNTYIIKKTVSKDGNSERYESQSGFVKINSNEDNNNKEYYINIGKSETYTELFDFINYNNSLIEMKRDEITDRVINSYYGSFINLFENNTNCFILAVIDSNNKFVLLKLNLSYNSNGNFQCSKIKEKTFEESPKNYVVSCYMYNDDLVCAFYSSNSSFKIIILDIEFHPLKDLIFQLVLNHHQHFFIN